MKWWIVEYVVDGKTIKHYFGTKVDAYLFMTFARSRGHESLTLYHEEKTRMDCDL